MTSTRGSTICLMYLHVRKTKRAVITKLLGAGLYPYTKRYLGTFDNHFSTIGLVGMNEALNANGSAVTLTHKEAPGVYKAGSQSYPQSSL